MNVQGSPSNGGREIAEEIFCFPSKLPLIVDRKQPKLHRLKVHAWEVGHVNFQEIPSNGSPSTAQNVLCSALIVPINYWPITPTLTSFVTHARKVRSMKFQVNSCNGGRDRLQKIRNSASKVPLIIDRSQTHLQLSLWLNRPFLRSIGCLLPTNALHINII
jgi:hypothetical protein